MFVVSYVGIGFTVLPTTHKLPDVFGGVVDTITLFAAPHIAITNGIVVVVVDVVVVVVGGIVVVVGAGAPHTAGPKHRFGL